MNLYPGIRGQMGKWTYYVVKMNMREIADSVKFAHDIYEDRTLDEAIQRALKESRVNKEIVTYLEHHDDRFFSSIVVAALNGNPKWFPVQVSDEMELLAGDERLDDTFGVLRFDGKQNYYALDGQHRLAAIKALVSPESDDSRDAPDGFEDEELSVIVVVPSQTEETQSFLRRYRRLFGHLNRYAKPTDKVTNIIMDEDDAFAICTRGLIMDHDFFKAAGAHKESPRIKTDKGKNLRRGDTFFTSLEALYDINQTLLHSRNRRNKIQGWCSDGEGREIKEFQRFRPSEGCLEELYNELALYWDGLIAELPVLESDPSTMRDHAVDPTTEEADPEAGEDHLIFWPIGQEMLAAMTRDLLDRRLPDPGHPTKPAVAEALKGLHLLEWRLHRPPWRYFMLVEGDKGWKMVSEDRKEVMNIGRQIQLWVLGVDEHDEAGLERLKQSWKTRLIPAQTVEESERMWAEVEERRTKIAEEMGL